MFRWREEEVEGRGGVPPLLIKAPYRVRGPGAAEGTEGMASGWARGPKPIVSALPASSAATDHIRARPFTGPVPL